MTYVDGVLTPDEYDVLNIIADRTHMDCWFQVCQNEETGKDYIYDLENDRILPLREGVGFLMEGLYDPINVDCCNLTEHQKAVWHCLLKWLDLA